MLSVLLPCVGLLFLDGCHASLGDDHSSELTHSSLESDRIPSKISAAFDESLLSTGARTPLAVPLTVKKEKDKKKPTSEKKKYEAKFDGGGTRHESRVRREISDTRDDEKSARALDRFFKLAAPGARSRLQTLWKRLRSVLLTSKDGGANGERADELTKALFQQLFKQFDLPTILRKRADKLRRRVGPNETVGATNTTAESPESNDTMRVVDFRKKGEDSKDGDKSNTNRPGLGGNVEENLTQKDKLDASSTTTSPTATSSKSTRYPQLSLFQKRKGPVQVSVKVPQKHAKSGIKRFSPAQGKSSAR